MVEEYFVLSQIRRVSPLITENILSELSSTFPRGEPQATHQHTFFEIFLFYIKS
jgi:hypothetical protein